MAQHSARTNRTHRNGLGTQLRPSLSLRSPPEKQRAQGKPGAHRTHGPRATKRHAAEPQVQADHPAFPAQWFYGLYVISSGTGLFCPRRFAGITRKPWRQRRGVRTTRLCRPRQARPSSAPLASTASRSASVTLRNAPLSGAGPNRYSADLGSASRESSENRKLWFRAGAWFGDF